MIPQELKGAKLTRVNFVTEQEGSMLVYLLEDGTTIRAKVVCMGIHRVEGQYNPDDSPMYRCQFVEIANIDAPENLKRK